MSADKFPAVQIKFWYNVIRVDQYRTSEQNTNAAMIALSIITGLTLKELTEHIATYDGEWDRLIVEGYRSS